MKQAIGTAVLGGLVSALVLAGAYYSVGGKPPADATSAEDAFTPP